MQIVAAGIFIQQRFHINSLLLAAVQADAAASRNADIMANDVRVLARSLWQILRGLVDNAVLNRIKQGVSVPGLICSGLFVQLAFSIFPLIILSLLHSFIAIDNANASPSFQQLVSVATLLVNIRQSVDNATGSNIQRHVAALGINAANAHIAIDLLQSNISLSRRIERSRQSICSQRLLSCINLERRIFILTINRTIFAHEVDSVRNDVYILVLADIALRARSRKLHYAGYAGSLLAFSIDRDIAVAVNRAHCTQDNVAFSKVRRIDSDINIILRTSIVSVNDVNCAEVHGIASDNSDIFYILSRLQINISAIQRAAALRNRAVSRNNANRSLFITCRNISCAILRSIQLRIANVAGQRNIFDRRNIDIAIICRLAYEFDVNRIICLEACIISILRARRFHPHNLIMLIIAPQAAFPLTFAFLHSLFIKLFAADSHLIVMLLLAINTQRAAVKPVAAYAITSLCRRRMILFRPFRQLCGSRAVIAPHAPAFILKVLLVFFISSRFLARGPGVF